MYNAKLVVLFKEFPWLSQIPSSDKGISSIISVTSVVKVERLDAATLGKRWVGSIVTSDDNYFIRAFYFDSDGVMLPVNNRPVSSEPSFWRRLWKRTTKASFNLDEVLVRYTERDRIRFIVFWGHDLEHYGQIQLYLYKVPKNKTVSDLLDELTKNREETKRNQLLDAEKEFRTEMEGSDN